ncbi:MAG TPA: phospholipase D-like domain-containing protein [Gemmatimonadales bacterium]|nr:phospholipase D-like domain-containing protein [Gemmatimonadales bacterium]
MVLWIVLAVLVTAAAVLVALNLASRQRSVERRIEHGYTVEDPQFARAMGSLLGPALVGGNRITPLRNGDRIFPAMLDAIRAARRSINFETYIYWSGDIGREFAEALSERARAGVPVRVLLDWVGAGKIDEALVERMEEAGVIVLRYHPLKWYNLGRLNNRTHRKLLVVDGVVGFTGGVGIADEWRGDAQDPHHWRDSHFLVEGPVVAQLQAAFMDNWIETRGEVLHGEEYFPALRTVGPQCGQVFQSSSDGGSESVRLMYLLSIASAGKRLRIANAYFVPDDLAVRHLVDAARRGVEVEIVVPGRYIDFTVVRKASRARWGPLLEAGIAIYEYQPTMYHTKVMIVDDLWVSVGSTNFDSRSFKLNDEANLNILDPELAAELARHFEEDKRRSQRVTLEEWRARPWRQKLQERTAELFRSQL